MYNSPYSEKVKKCDDPEKPSFFVKAVY